MKKNERAKTPVTLDLADTPEKLKELPKEQIPALCGEIRRFLVDRVTENGGHLASNLGVVELTVAIHRVFDAPRDHVLFDVGHQSYVHKLLTGRREQFATLRTPGGLSGFPTRRESEYDPFGAGHSSTALSAALGFATADKLRGSEAYTVAVVGDGAFTGGMVHEALNNCAGDLRLVVILNENEMSISRNIGKFAAAISRMRVSRRYNRTKRRTRSVLTHIPLLGVPMEKLLIACKKKAKNAMFGSNWLEDLGFFYVGPIDGNDEQLVEQALTEAKLRRDCVIVHVKTKKGKGYPPAEEHPDLYHGVSAGPDAPAFHQAAGECLAAMADEDGAVCAITAAMGAGTGLAPFAERHRDRYFDVGIAEEHAATFAAGLAAAGMKPYFAVYSTFLQRAYDNVLHDIALQGLPVRLLVDRTALAAGDGATHHGVFDVSFLSSIPGIRILAPALFGTLERMLRDSASATAPLAIRYPNCGEVPGVREAFYPDGDLGAYGVRADFAPGEPVRAVLLAYGRIVGEAMAAARTLRDEGIPTGVILLEQLAPYAETAEKLLPLLPEDAAVVFLEESVKAGGAGMHLAAAAEALDPGFTLRHRYRHLAIEDPFAVQPAPGDPLAFFGICAKDAAIAVREALAAPRT